MYGSGYVFSKKFFTGWITVGILWIFCSFGAVGLFPVYEGRRTLLRTFKFMYLDVTGKWHPNTIHAEEVPAVTSDKGGVAGDETPPQEKSAMKTEISG
jgi:hypothetical protein